MMAVLLGKFFGTLLVILVLVGWYCAAKRWKSNRLQSTEQRAEIKPSEGIVTKETSPYRLKGEVNIDPPLIVIEIKLPKDPGQG